MAEATNWPPLTAREALVAFYGKAHDGIEHTVMSIKPLKRVIELTCTCGKAGIKIYDPEAKAKGWTLDEVKKALRNVPTR